MSTASGFSKFEFSIALCQLAGTPYEGGVFKMKLVLAKDFPASPPQGR